MVSVDGPGPPGWWTRWPPRSSLQAWLDSRTRRAGETEGAERTRNHKGNRRPMSTERRGRRRSTGRGGQRRLRPRPLSEADPRPADPAPAASGPPGPTGSPGPSTAGTTTTPTHVRGVRGTTTTGTTSACPGPPGGTSSRAGGGCAGRDRAGRHGRWPAGGAAQINPPGTGAAVTWWCPTAPRPRESRPAGGGRVIGNWAVISVNTQGQGDGGPTPLPAGPLRHEPRTPRWPSAQAVAEGPDPADHGPGDVPGGTAADGTSVPGWRPASPGSPRPRRCRAGRCAFRVRTADVNNLGDCSPGTYTFQEGDTEEQAVTEDGEADGGGGQGDRFI